VEVKVNESRRGNVYYSIYDGEEGNGKLSEIAIENESRKILLGNVRESESGNGNDSGCENRKHSFESGVGVISSRKGNDDDDLLLLLLLGHHDDGNRQKNSRNRKKRAIGKRKIGTRKNRNRKRNRRLREHGVVPSARSREESIGQFSIYG
jgi:hypothetical protein